jgi:hypothetical protein
MQGMPENKKKSGECEEHYSTSRERVEGHKLDYEEASDKPHQGSDREGYL